MKYRVACVLLLAFAVEIAHASDLDDRWGEKISPQEVSHKAHFNPFRIMNRTFDSVAHFAVGVYDLADFKKEDHLAVASFQFAESFLNPFGLADAVISDVGALAKSPFYMTKRMSRRVQVCTGNLGLIYDDYNQNAYPEMALAAPISHIGVIIDGEERFTDTGGGGLSAIQDKGGLNCSDVPIMSSEPEAVAIERLTFVGQSYEPNYSIIAKNCGYFTRDVLSASGFAYPILPNAGIGTEVPLTIHPMDWAKERTSDVQSLLALKLQADLHLSKLRKIFQELEAGSVPDVQLDASELGNVSLDVVLQLLASSSRGNNLKAQAWVTSQLNTTLFDSEVLQPLKNKLKQKDGKEDVKSIFGGLQKSDLNWFVQSQKDSGGADAISQVIDLIFA